MNRMIKSVISAALIFGSAVPLCACDSNKKSEEARVYSESFCQDVLNGDAGKLITYFADAEMDETFLADIVCPPDLNPGQSTYFDMIKSTMEYSVQDPVYDYNTKTATVYASFVQADYTSEEALKACDAEGFSEVLSSGKSTIITTCLTIDLNGETPKIVNPMDTINEVYAFYDSESGVMPGLLSDYFDSSKWTESCEAVNCNSLTIHTPFKDELGDFRFVPSAVWTVTKDDTVVFSDYYSFEGICFTPADLGTDSKNSDGFFAEGNYEFTLNDEYGNEICCLSVTMKAEELEDDPVSIADYDKNDYFSGIVFEARDNDIMSGFSPERSGWWDYDGTSVGKSVFALNTKTIGFSLAVCNEGEAGYRTDEETETEEIDAEGTETEGTVEPGETVPAEEEEYSSCIVGSLNSQNGLYYDYFYCEKSDFEGIGEAEPVYQSSCVQTEYDDMTCYDFDYSSVEMQSGYYALVVYSDPGRRHIVFVAACLVVEETTDDVNSDDN